MGWGVTFILEGATLYIPELPVGAFLNAVRGRFYRR
jgi:hypothetical protein